MVEHSPKILASEEKASLKPVTLKRCIGSKNWYKSVKLN